MDDILTLILSCIHLTIFFGEEKFSWLPSKNKVADENSYFQRHTNFLVKLFLAGSQLNFSSQKNCQMKAGQYTIQLTNPVIRYYNPMPGNQPPFVSGENIFANIEFWSENRVP